MRIRWFDRRAGLVGAVWIGQGLGLIRGQGFMDDDVRWAVIGAVLLVVGDRRSAGARSGGAGGLEPGGPGRLGASGGHLVPVADQRQPEEPRIGQEPGHDPGVVEPHVGEAGVAVGRRVVSRSAPAPSRWTNRRSSPGAIGRFRRST